MTNTDTLMECIDCESYGIGIVVQDELEFRFNNSKIFGWICLVKNKGDFG
jgi:hypothetical protein